MPRSPVDARVIGSILCARFADHQPHNRQSDQLARPHGVKLDRAPSVRLMLISGG